jgi:hypothetical protein
MTQCLMGHGIVAYTVELSIRYRNPVLVHETICFETRITERKRGLLYMLESSVRQGARTLVRATGKFYKAEKSNRNGELA